MAISGKPQKLTPAKLPGTPPDEELVRSLINKGGSVADATRGHETASIKPMLVQLRLYRGMVEEIDAARSGSKSRRRRAPSRHAWIVEAIEEKLEREKGI
jgi:hypothetical protein